MREWLAYGCSVFLTRRLKSKVLLSLEASRHGSENNYISGSIRQTLFIDTVKYRVFVKFLNSSAQIGNNRDQNNYLLKTCYTASCEVAGTQIEIAE